MSFKFLVTINSRCTTVEVALSVDGLLKNVLAQHLPDTVERHGLGNTTPITRGVTSCIANMAWSTRMQSSIHSKPISYTGKAIINMISYTIFLILACSRNGRSADAKTRPKIGEELNQKTLRHDVCKLMGGQNMKNSNLPQGHLLMDEVDVNLDMLHAPMMDQVGCHIDSTDVVTVDNGGGVQRDMELLEKLAQPTALGDGMGDSSILSLGARPGHHGPTLGGPGDQVVAKKDAEAGGRESRVRTPCPVRI
jgi:hypothetical protein